MHNAGAATLRLIVTCGIVIAASMALTFMPAAYAQPTSPAPPSNVSAVDHPWDNGSRIDLNWSISSDDAKLQGYIIRKKTSSETEFSPVEIVPRGTNRFTVSDLNYETSYLKHLLGCARLRSDSLARWSGTCG